MYSVFDRCCRIHDKLFKNYGYQFENGTGSVGYNDSTGLEIDTAMDRIDASKFTAAQIYPGMVTPLQPRIKDTILNIDLNYQTATASDLRVSVLPSNWISTGLWRAGRRAD